MAPPCPGRAAQSQLPHTLEAPSEQDTLNPCSQTPKRWPMSSESTGKWFPEAVCPPRYSHLGYKGPNRRLLPSTINSTIFTNHVSICSAPDEAAWITFRSTLDGQFHIEAPRHRDPSKLHQHFKHALRPQPFLNPFILGRWHWDFFLRNVVLGRWNCFLTH